MFHVEGCDFETCPACGGQLISCGCDFKDSERIPWSGERPAKTAAREFDFWCYWDPAGAGIPKRFYGHIPCEPTHPKASLDLNRVYRECAWDRASGKFLRIRPDKAQ